MPKLENFFYDEKTANVILVYQYSSIIENKQISRVRSLTPSSLTPQTKSVICLLASQQREVEPLDSWGWQRTPAKETTYDH